MKVNNLILFVLVCSNVFGSEEDSRRYTLSTSRVVNLDSVHISPALPVGDALQDIFEPDLARQQHAAHQHELLWHLFFEEHNITNSLVQSAFKRHKDNAPVTRSHTDTQQARYDFLLEVIEKSEILVQQQTQQITDKDGELSRQTTLLKDQQKQSDKDKKRWACGSVVATVTALMAPLAPIIATAYSAIAGQCAEQCAELCSS